MDMVNADAMPGGAHPDLADLNREMAFHYARRNGAFETPYMHEVGRQRAAYGEDSIVEQGFKRHLLTLRRVAAPCPYVGRTPQRFTWDVLVDEAGRCIADDRVYRVVDQSRAFIEGWQGADDERVAVLAVPERHVCPECEQGKHANCDGTAWDDHKDEPTSCTCQHGATS